MRAHESSCKHKHVRVIRQRQALHLLAGVEQEGIAVKVELPCILRAVFNVAIRHGDRFRFAQVARRRIPVAEALRELRCRAIGIRHRQRLRALVAVDSGSQQLQRSEVASRQCDHLTCSGNRVGNIRLAEVELDAVEHARQRQQIGRVGIAGKPALFAEVRAVAVNRIDVVSRGETDRNSLAPFASSRAYGKHCGREALGDRSRLRAYGDQVVHAGQRLAVCNQRQRAGVRLLTRQDRREHTGRQSAGQGEVHPAGESVLRGCSHSGSNVVALVEVERRRRYRQPEIRQSKRYIRGLRDSLAGSCHHDQQISRRG